jgi:hypothetical protein
MSEIQKNIEISFRLPTCLYLQNEHVFSIEPNIAIRVKEIREESDTRFGTVKNMEVCSDTDAAFRFSELTVIIPDLNPKIPDENLLDVYNQKIIEVANKFIDTFRFFTGRHAIANIQDLRNARRLSIRRVPGDTIGEYIFSFGQGSSMRTLVTLHTPEQHKKIQELLNNNLPLEQLFIMDAIRHYTLGHYLQSLVSAIIALEITVNSYPDIKIPWILKIFFKQKNLEYKIGKLLNNKTEVSLIVGAIRKRNGIIHGGDRNIGEEILQKYLVSIKNGIETIKNASQN